MQKPIWKGGLGLLNDYNRAEIWLEGCYIRAILPKNELMCSWSKFGPKNMFTSLEAASARQDGSLAAPDKRSGLVCISGHGTIGTQHGGVN